MSLLVLLIVAVILAALLAGLVFLGIVARRQYQYAESRSDHGWGVPITEEVDVVAVYARGAVEAAERALDEAEWAQHQAVHAVAAREMAERRYQLVMRQGEAAGEPYRLVQRAALNAYRSRQLSAAELNRIWRHAPVAAEPCSRGVAVVPPGWEVRVGEARRRFELAVAEMERVQEEAHLKTVIAATLAEEARAAESHFSAALRSANTGLVGLLRAAWAMPSPIDPDSSSHPGRQSSYRTRPRWSRCWYRGRCADGRAFGRSPKAWR